MGDGTGFDDVLLGLPGFVVTAVVEQENELLIGIETIRAGRDARARADRQEATARGRSEQVPVPCCSRSRDLTDRGSQLDSRDPLLGDIGHGIVSRG